MGLPCSIETNGALWRHQMTLGIGPSKQLAVVNARRPLLEPSLNSLSADVAPGGMHMPSTAHVEAVHITDPASALRLLAGLVDYFQNNADTVIKAIDAHVITVNDLVRRNHELGEAIDGVAAHLADNSNDVEDRDV